MFAIFPEVRLCIEAEDMERLAVLVRHYFGREGATKPKLDVEALLANFGLHCQTTDIPYRGALLVQDRRGQYQISLVIDRSVEGAEKAFLLAHLLGHFLLHAHNPLAQGECTELGFGEDLSPLLRYEQAYYPEREAETEAAVPCPSGEEEKADQFAAALLMPQGMFLKACKNLQPLERVADFFGVSCACAARRLRELEAEPQEEPLAVSKVSAVPASKLKPGRSTVGLQKLRELAKRLDDSVKL